MCGIICIHAFDAPVDRARLEAGVAALRHRGPDAQRTWVSDDQHVGLGHARLSIIDLEGGQQPLVSRSHGLSAVVNGEFYGFEDIRRDLMARGHAFATASDSEILLPLYAEHGPDCLDSLRGEFAFCLWDARQRMLVAARDRCGAKPLYYAIDRGRLVLASEIKALVAAGVQARWDEESLASRGFALSDRTLFAGVHQVPPGHMLVATRGGVRIRSYWDFDHPTTDRERIHDPREAAEELRRALLSAVETRLRADVPVAVYLSGGIDSGIVLGAAARLAARPPTCFTLSIRHPLYDERSIASEAAARVGARHHIVPVGFDDIADALDDAVWHAESQLVTTNGVAKLLLSRAVRDAGYRVALVGEGADELFAGYAHFRQDQFVYGGIDSSQPVDALLADLRQRNLASAGSAIADPGVVDPALAAACRGLGMVPHWLRAQVAMYAGWRALMTDDARACHAQVDPLRQFIFGQDMRRLRGRAPLDVSLYLWGRSILPNYILSILGDRMDMAHGVEARLPFLDRDVIEVATRLAPDLKIRGSTEKFVLREAGRPFLTETMYAREKHPFRVPPASFDTESRLYALIRDTISGSAMNAVPWFDRARVLRYLDTVATGSLRVQVVAEPVVLGIVTLCLLARRFRL